MRIDVGPGVTGGPVLLGVAEEGSAEDHRAQSLVYTGFYHDAGLRGTHDGVPAETAAIRHDFVGEMAVAAGADGGGDRVAKIFVVFEFAKIGLDLIDRSCGSDRDGVQNGRAPCRERGGGEV